jgi:phosphomannomutase
LKEMVLAGDALSMGGDDFPAEETGVVSIPVRGPDENKPATEIIIVCLGGSGPTRRLGRM